MKVQKFETVMIIDDNNIDLYISSRLMMKNDFANTILEYSSAEEAIKYLKTGKLLPEIIFVDIYMPIMSGFEFVDAFQSLPADFKQSCRIFVISSTIDNTDIDWAKSNANIAGFREKPVDRAFLEEIKTTGR